MTVDTVDVDGTQTASQNTEDAGAKQATSTSFSEDPDRTELLEQHQSVLLKVQEEMGSLKKMFANLMKEMSSNGQNREEIKEDGYKTPEHVTFREEVLSDQNMRPGSPVIHNLNKNREDSLRRDFISSTRYDNHTMGDVSPMHTVPINQINPPKFDGDKSKARSWLKEYDETMEINGYNGQIKLKRAMAYLSGEGRQFYDVINHRNPELDWVSFKKSFLRHFCGFDARMNLLNKLNETRQTSDENPNSYAMRLLSLCYQYDNRMSEESQLERLVNGLSIPILNALIAAKDQEEWTLKWVLSKLEVMKSETKKPLTETSRKQTNPQNTQRKATSPSETQKRKPRNLAEWVCFNCDQKGHVIEECKKPRDEAFVSARKEKFRQEMIKKREAGTINSVSKSRKPKKNRLPCEEDLKPLLTLNINGKEVQGRIDSGADMTVIPSDVADTLNLIILPWDSSSLEAANKTELELVGMSAIIVRHNNRTQSLIVAIMPKESLYQPLWGNDLLRLFAMKLDFGIQDTQIETTASVDVDAAQSKIVSTVNTEKQHPVDKIQFGELDVESHKLFEDTLTKYADTFSRNDLDIGRTSTIKHRITLIDTTPVHRPPYRIPVRNRDAMEEMIKEKLETGAFRESKSPYASPVFFVDKDQGKSKRLVADYRALNAKTVPDRTPMPHPEDVFSLLANTRIFAKLDITSMFNQIEVDERDVEKTAIATPFGLYECPLMPFGLVNAPATAVRLMKEVLRDLDGRIAFVYFDDIIIFAKDANQLLERCTLVLERVRQHNLKLKPSKCIFAVKTVQFLGHVIDEKGIHIDERRIEKVKSFPVPRNPSDVRSFHGLCSYNRKFIKGFANIAKPLTPLMGKPTDFAWTSEAQKAFEQLRDSLVRAPTLVHYEPRADHELRTDASSYAIGAVLYQKYDDPNLTGVVLYYSKTLTSTQRNYSATERELLAAFSAITDLKHFLYGKRFTLVTDHAALSLLRNHKDPHQRLARWVAQLQAFEFDVVYKRGAEHLDADCMSRLTLDQAPLGVDVDTEQGERIIRSICAVNVNNEPAQSEETEEPVESPMRIDQRRDDFCRKIIDILESTALTDDEKLRKAKGFTLQDDGILYKVCDGRFTVVIPERRRPRILLNCHDAPFGAHLGFSRTYAKIKSRFYWPKLRKDVKKHVTTCDKCQRRKANNTRKQGLIKPLPIAEDVFDTVGVDLITKLPVSKGYNGILVCTDNLSKYVVTVPLRNEETETFITAFFNFFIAKHGCPKLVISDRGSNLKSKMAQDFFELYGIKRQMTSPYHPQSNGQTERFNRTLAAALTMYVSESQQEWSSYLQAMTFAYNISEHSVTRVSPYELVFNRRPRLPIDNTMERHEFVDPDQPAPSALSTAAMQLMKGYILDSQRKNKARLDTNRIPCTYKVGDLVVVERPTRCRDGVGKLNFSYVGPYKIMRKISDLNFEIVNLKGPLKTFVVHPAIIKRYHERTSDVADQRPSEEQQVVPQQHEDETAFVPREPFEVVPPRKGSADPANTAADLEPQLLDVALYAQELGPDIIPETIDISSVPPLLPTHLTQAEEERLRPPVLEEHVDLD